MGTPGQQLYFRTLRCRHHGPGQGSDVTCGPECCSIVKNLKFPWIRNRKVGLRISSLYSFVSGSFYFSEQISVCRSIVLNLILSPVFDTTRWLFYIQDLSPTVYLYFPSLSLSTETFTEIPLISLLIVYLLWSFSVQRERLCCGDSSFLHFRYLYLHYHRCVHKSNSTHNAKVDSFCQFLPFCLTEREDESVYLQSGKREVSFFFFLINNNNNDKNLFKNFDSALTWRVWNVTSSTPGKWGFLST